MENEKSKSKTLWSTWYEDYREAPASSIVWARWSKKVREQIEALERDMDAGVPNELLEARADLILDLLDDFKLEKKTRNGNLYLAMKRRFL